MLTLTVVGAGGAWWFFDLFSLQGDAPSRRVLSVWLICSWYPLHCSILRHNSRLEWRQSAAGAVVGPWQCSAVGSDDSCSLSRGRAEGKHDTNNLRSLGAWQNCFEILPLNPAPSKMERNGLTILFLISIGPNFVRLYDDFEDTYCRARQEYG
jgi:hypothetical protein